jgi:hypothetical protein
MAIYPWRISPDALLNAGQYRQLPLRVTLLTTTAPVTVAMASFSSGADIRLPAARPARRRIKTRGVICDAGTGYGTGMIRLRAR